MKALGEGTYAVTRCNPLACARRQQNSLKCPLKNRSLIPINLYILQCGMKGNNHVPYRMKVSRERMSVNGCYVAVRVSSHDFLPIQLSFKSKGASIMMADALQYAAFGRGEVS